MGGCNSGYNYSMYKFSKISLLIFYPTLSLLLPILFFSTLFLSMKDGGNEFAGMSIVLLISTLTSLLLLILAIIYAFQAYKSKLFILQPDGTRRAKVSDYFAAAFATFIIGSLLSNLVKLIF